MNVPDHTPSQDTVAARVATLRDTLGLTQEQVAEGSSGKLRRTEVVKIEGGLNKATTDKVRSGLALAFKVSRDDMAAYLDGTVSLAVLLQRRNGVPASPEPAPLSVIEYDDRYPNRARAKKLALEEGVDESAIQAVLQDSMKSDHDLPMLEWLQQMKMRAEFFAKMRAKTTEQKAAEVEASRQLVSDVEAMAEEHRKKKRAERAAKQG